MQPSPRESACSSSVVSRKKQMPYRESMGRSSLPIFRHLNSADMLSLNSSMDTSFSPCVYRQCRRWLEEE